MPQRSTSGRGSAAGRTGNRAREVNEAELSRLKVDELRERLRARGGGGTGDGGRYRARRPPRRTALRLPGRVRERPAAGGELGGVVRHLRPARVELHLPGAAVRRYAEQLLPAREPRPGRRLT